VVAEIIAVGSELLTPYFTDTNSLFLCAGLNEIGITVSFKTIVGDDEKDLAEALTTALRRSPLVLAMGGLGPTEDDRTREVFARILKRKLVFRGDVLDAIRARFGRRGLAMPPANRKQAYAIEGAEILGNPNGTAPGLWFDDGRRRIALLPGPPRELEPMFENHLRPRLASLGRGRVIRRTIRLTGIGESLMESRMRDIYKGLPAGVGLTTLAAPGDLSIHLTAQAGDGEDAAGRRLDRLVKRILRRLAPWVYSTGGENLECVVGRLLGEAGQTVSAAESCSGGLLSHRLTNVPGSSGWFLESVVTYSDASKRRRLGVPSSLLERHGAVSGPVARAMAEGIRRRSGSDFGLGITGIAGPAGASPRKPVGLVYIALSHPRGTALRRSNFIGGREQVKFQSSQKALDLLRSHLTKTGERR
jgi:nicotinamide-nucleotide amidase